MRWSFAAYPSVRQTCVKGRKSVRHTALGLSLLLTVGCGSAPRRQSPIRVPLPAPPRPLEELVQQLSAADAASRAAAAWSLAGAENPDPSVVRALKIALDDPSAPVREAAIWALSHIKGAGIDRGTLFDSPPRPLVITKPSYPQAAFDKKTEGTVMVAVLISELGRVVHAEIRESLPGLDEAALACVRDWQFEPAKRAGKPVACVAYSPVSFRIH
jgi:TonB family protein